MTVRREKNAPKTDLGHAAWFAAWKWPRRERVADLRRRLSSRKVDERLLALHLMRRQLNQGRPMAYFEMARQAIPDRNNDCRWQAMIVIGEFIPYAPEAVWAVAREWAESADDDMRTAVQTVLLEHLLEHDFRRYFPKVARRVRGGARGLESILAGCWGMTEKQERQLRELVSKPRGGARRRITMQ